ncbi:2TM domain-containing protein [Gillisia mitskevichiae]|uniref:2TM domain-containing protein n=1 Tax=Gillisia mitskevichiae TaxID=270921 RepID=A0A495PRT2_9FLAO|nr:2TM domain-containing protein [Gillisia mitskevichiae]RKS53344.1 2TM domain-containing protein [Gillisia mitskevichiae]
MENSEKNYQRAKERVEELKKFYSHLLSYIVVNIFLAAVNYYSNEWRYPWFLWVTAGWGIGLIFDAMRAHQINPMFNKDWEERKIRSFMKEEEKQKWE